LATASILRFPYRRAHLTTILKIIDYSLIITIEPDKSGGKPCICGLRIIVYDVLDYLASWMTVDAIRAEFSDCTAEDIRACLAVAADRERRVTGRAA